MELGAFSSQTGETNMTEATAMLIETSVKNQIGTITLNDRKTLNSLSSSLIKELLDALEDFRDEGIRVVILRAPSGAKRNAFPSRTDQRAKGVRSWNCKLCPASRPTGSQDIRVSAGYTG
jgi:1,4-dihydroxy-2-naphthoyl-CoA synthase